VTGRDCLGSTAGQNLDFEIATAGDIIPMFLHERFCMVLKGRKLQIAGRNERDE
jgi:hypothetical protein